jgi:Cu2+-exporting ATPase
MDLLVALGVLTSYSYSLFGLFTGGEVYFDSAAMIVTLLLLGRLLESGARNKAAAGIEGLLDLAPDTATRLDAGRPVQITSDALRPGDLILVGPGERLPVDGALAEGQTEIDESVVSGEPLPVFKRAGDRVVAGSLNLSTAITLRVGTTAAESFPARAARLVEEAQARRAPIQRLADRVAAWFVPAVILLAALTWLYWSRQPGGAGTPLLNAVAVLVVACPCALGLATPTAILVASATAARRGIFFRGGDVIERVARLDVIAFDKTGTLTRGRPAVTGVTAADGVDADEVVATAARIESGSAHPLARGIMAEATRRALHVPLAGGARSFPGLGVSLTTDSGLLLAGRHEFLENHGVVAPVQEEDLTMVHVARGDAYLGAISLEDPLRNGAEEAIAALQRLGIATALLTGDRPGAGKRIASRVGIDDVHGGLVPEEKASWIEARRRLGGRVMMVGDGINDAPALAAADVGCAPAGGTDLALDTSDLVLTRPDLGRLVEAVGLGRRTLAIVRQNLFWAFCYNLLALPLAASGRLLPIHAAAAMAFSSVCVVANSLRLARNRRLRGAGPAGAEGKVGGRLPASGPLESRQSSS